MTTAKEPMFIIGCPRSGTTLLSQLLQFTDYGAPVETHFITKYYKRLHKYTPLSDRKNTLKLVKDILKERPVMQWKLDINPETLLTQLKTGDYPEIVNAICHTRFRSLGYLSWGDKTPHYINDIDIIFKLFPESKYLHIIRDGRDVALSLLQKKWGPNNIYACATYWRDCNSKTSVIEQIKTKGLLHKIRYEDLLSNPQKELEEVFSFLGVKEDQKKISSVIKPIIQNNFNKWQERMSPSEIKLFENIASDILNQNGYKTIHPVRKISAVVKLRSILSDMMLHYTHLIKMNIVDTILIKFFGKEPFAE